MSRWPKQATCPVLAVVLLAVGLLVVVLLGSGDSVAAQVPVTPMPGVLVTPTASPAPTPAAKPAAPPTPTVRPPTPTPPPATTPRAGGVPPELAFGLLGGGAAALAGGLALLRRGRR